MPFGRLFSVSLTLITAFAASTVDAQYYRRGRGSVFIRAPFVGVNVTPGGVSVRAPGVNVDTPRGGYAYGVPVYPGGAVVVPGPTVVGAPTPTVVTRPVSPRLNEADLAALGTADLLAELANRSNELNAELGKLGGGQAWQKYLALPAGVDAGQIDPALLGRLLARFDSVARDRQFRMISSLEGFEPVRTALRVTVDQFTVAPATPPAAPAGPSLGPVPGPASGAVPPTGESLPTPKPDAKTGERSVLKL